MTHADMKMDDCCWFNISCTAPSQARTYLRESDQFLGLLEKLMMTFRRVLESVRARLEHAGLAEGAEATWAAKQWEAPDFVICFQELHQLQLSLVTLTFGYISAVRPRKALSFSASMLDLVMPHLHIWVSP